MVQDSPETGFATVIRAANINAEKRYARSKENLNTGNFGISERWVCRVLGRHQSAQRDIPAAPDDEVALTTDIIELARQYDRYEYHRNTALLRRAGWTVNKKRIETRRTCPQNKILNRCE